MIGDYSSFQMHSVQQKLQPTIQPDSHQGQAHATAMRSSAAAWPASRLVTDPVCDSSGQWTPLEHRQNDNQHTPPVTAPSPFHVSSNSRARHEETGAATHDTNKRLYQEKTLSVLSPRATMLQQQSFDLSKLSVAVRGQLPMVVWNAGRWSSLPSAGESEIILQDNLSPAYVESGAEEAEGGYTSVMRARPFEEVRIGP